jgi:hypothetical protein
MFDVLDAVARSSQDLSNKVFVLKALFASCRFKNHFRIKDGRAFNALIA